jgi:hypothetical protein
MQSKDVMGKHVRLNTVVVRFDRFGVADFETTLGLLQALVKAVWWKGWSRKRKVPNDISCVQSFAGFTHKKLRCLTNSAWPVMAKSFHSQIHNL